MALISVSTFQTLPVLVQAELFHVNPLNFFGIWKLLEATPSLVGLTIQWVCCHQD